MSVTTQSGLDVIPFNSTENATIISLVSGVVPGVSAGTYHLYEDGWHSNSTNRQMSAPTDASTMILQEVELDTSTDSDTGDYIATNAMPKVLSSAQITALKTFNGPETDNNLILINMHMNLQSVPTPMRQPEPLIADPFDLSTSTTTQSGPDVIPFSSSENATIISLASGDIPGVSAGTYHLYEDGWHNHNHNLQMSAPTDASTMILQEVELDNATTSNSTDYKPTNAMPFELTSDQINALKSANGSESENNLILFQRHMNLDTTTTMREVISKSDHSFSISDFFLNEGDFFSYQVPRPSFLDATYVLTSATLNDNIWWENPDAQWLTVTPGGLLQGTAEFGHEDREQGYNILLDYTSSETYNTVSINEYFQVFVNSYVKENDWGKDFNYNLNYGLDARDVFAKPIIEINKRDNEYNLDLVSPNNKPFDLVDSNGAPITDPSSLFQIHHLFLDNGVLGEDNVVINGYQWWGYSQENLSIKIQPNFYNGLNNFGDTDVIQVSILTDAFMKQGDVLTPLSYVIPDEFIYKDYVAYDDKVSIDLSDHETIDPSNIINAHDFSGVYINAGADDIDHEGSIIPAYTSIAPDGSVLDISAISAEDHGLYITSSPLSDVIYVDTEEGDWPIIEWSPGDDYIAGPTSGAAFRANNYHDWQYQSDLDEGLTFQFNDNVLTVASEYGVITAENISDIYGTKGNDTIIGDENFQNFRGDGGYDTYTGGIGRDDFRVESQYYRDDDGNDVLLNNFIRITDFERSDRISIENYGFSLDKETVSSQFSVSQDFDNLQTYISIDTDQHTIDNLFTIDGIFYLNRYKTVEDSRGDVNLRIRLEGTDNPNNYNLITGSENSDILIGTVHQDIITGGTGDDFIFAEHGDDLMILTSSGSQTFDGGKGNDALEFHLKDSNTMFDGYVNLAEQQYDEINSDPVFEIKFSDTQVLYSSSSPSFSNSYLNIKITDANGDQWTSTDGLTNGVGGTGIFFPKDNLNFPIEIEVELYQAEDFSDTPSVLNYIVESNSGNISDPNNKIFHQQEFIQPISEINDPAFGIQFSDTQVLYSSSSSFSNGSLNIKVTDANGGQWTSSDGLTNGAGGSGLFFPKDNLNFPLNVELEVYQTNDFTGTSSVFNYIVESNSGSISDPNNNISMIVNNLIEQKNDNSNTLVNIENVKIYGDIDHIIIGDEKNNKLITDGGNDIISGGAGNDILDSGAGNDEVYGGDGDDLIIQTGSGTQYYNGGEGVDTYFLDLGGWQFADDFIGEVNLETNFSGIHSDHSHELNDVVVNMENITLKGDVDFVMKGDDKNNVIITAGGDDELHGGDGNDVLVSGSGNDFVYGEDGDDVLVLTSSGTQHFDGGEGTDKFEIYVPDWKAPDGFVGSVDLNSGFAGSASDPINLLNDKLVNIENVTIIAQYDYLIHGNQHDNVLIGGSGNDTLSTGSGNDQLFGGLGDDTLIINGSGNSVVDGGQGVDTFKIDLTTYVPSVNDQEFTFMANLSTGFSGSKNEPEHVNNDYLIDIENIQYIGSINAELYGDEGDNTIFGGSGSDYIYGGDGNDTLKPGDGDDYIYGEAGNDILTLTGSGTQIFNGGEGIDTFKLDGFMFEGMLDPDFDQIIEIDLSNNVSRQKDNTFKQDTLVDIEDIMYRGSHDVEMTGDDANNRVFSDAGNDVLNGGKGNDILRSGAGDDEVYGGDGDDLIIQNGSGTQYYDGGKGNDTLQIDTSFVAQLNPDHPNSITINIDEGKVQQTGNDNLADTFDNIENVTFIGDFDAIIVGNEFANIIRGGAGNDHNMGGSGDDIIYASIGNDIEDGGEGIDTYVIDADMNYVPVIDLVRETAYLQGTEPVAPFDNAVKNFENVTMLGSTDIEIIGSSADNVIIGGSGNDILSTGSGDDRLFGGLGNDTLIINGSGDSVLDGGDGVDTFRIDLTDYVPPEGDSNFKYMANLVTGFAGSKNDPLHVNNDDLVNIENIQYDGSIDAELYGDAGNNSIQGGSGNDFLFGGDGNDILSSGAGDDIVNGENGDDIIIQNGSGTQYYDGGEGVDTYVLDLEAFTLPEDFIVEVNLSTKFSGDHDDHSHALNDNVHNMENVTLISDVDSLVIGDQFNNIIKTGDGDDELRGGEGNDILKSGAGNDYVYGEGGNDTIIQNGSGAQYYDGGEGVDTYVLDLENFNLQENFIVEVNLNTFFSGVHLNHSHPLNDSVYNMENIKLKGDIDSVMTGDAYNNVISTDGGDDIIHAGDGNDEIRAEKGNDEIDAGGGNDYIRSGKGYDIITTGTGFDLVHMHKNHATHSLETTDKITDFEIGFDKIELENITYSDISINQGVGEYINDTIISNSDGYLAILENINSSSITSYDFYQTIELSQDGSAYFFPDLYTNHNQFVQYIIEGPDFLSDDDILVDATLRKWEGEWVTSDTWLSLPTTPDLHSNTILNGLPDFFDKEHELSFEIRLEYASGYEFVDLFQVFVNSYVEADEWSKDFAYNLNYEIDPRNIFGFEKISISKYSIDGSDEYRMELRGLTNDRFDLVNSNGDIITDLNTLFKIHHLYFDDGISNSNIISINGEEWWGYGGDQKLSLKIQPAFTNGSDTFVNTDVVQVELLIDAFMKQGDVLTPLIDVIPEEYIYQENVAFIDKETIDFSEAESLDPGDITNIHDFSGVFINAGADEIDHEGLIIPAYTSIAPDGSILDITAVSAEEHGLVITPSPLSDVIYVDTEDDDWPVIDWSAGDDYIVGPNSGAAFRGNDYHDWFYQSDLDKGLIFQFNDNVLTVESEYGVITAENIRNIYGTKGNDTIIGDENYQDFRGDGGYDTYTGGIGRDDFRVESQYYRDDDDNDVLLNNFIRITDFENLDRISIEDYGFSSNDATVASQFSVTQNVDLNETYISINTPIHTISNLFTIDGIFYLSQFSTSEDSRGDVNLKIRLSDLENNFTSGDDLLGPLGEWWEQDVVLSGLDNSYNLTGGLGDDTIGGGSRNDVLDGGKELFVNQYGNDVDEDGLVSKDQLIYLDAPSGINGNLITGVIQDGYGSVDQVSNFERFYGSFYNDTITLSNELFRGYIPAYGNDTIIGLDTLDGPHNSFIGYWNLDANNDVTDEYIVVNYDNGTVDKTILGGDFAGTYQDIFTNYVGGIVGSKGDDVFYGLSSGAYYIPVAGYYSDNPTGTIDSGYGTINGYHGNDTIIALGSGEDRLIGGRGDDVIITYGHGEKDKISGHNHDGSISVAKLSDDFDTFVIGGSGKVHITDYQVGEEIILLDYDLQSLEDITVNYDFIKDQTTLSFASEGEEYSDRVLINGRLMIDSFEQITFNNSHTNDTNINNAIADYKIVLDNEFAKVNLIIHEKAEFTASIDKWGGGGSSWLDDPVMKLHSKDNDVISPVGIDLSTKSGHPGHKHKPDMDKGTYELRVEHNQNTDGAINIDDVMGVLSLSRGISQTTSEEHKLAADWNSDGLINIDDVMGVLSRSRGIEKNDEWRFYDKGNDKSLWDNASKMNKMDIVLEDDKDIELSAILRGDVNGSYKADQHDRPDPSPAPTSNLAPLPLNNDDELLTINPDIV